MGSFGCRGHPRCASRLQIDHTIDLLCNITPHSMAVYAPLSDICSIDMHFSGRSITFYIYPNLIDI